MTRPFARYSVALQSLVDLSTVLLGPLPEPFLGSIPFGQQLAVGAVDDAVR
jgi:hypothetical protein